MSRACRYLFMLAIWVINPNLIFASDDRFSIVDGFENSYLFHGDYSPPAPTPPSLPPLPPSSSCECDLNGFGSLESVCKINSSLDLTNDLYIKGSGSFVIDPGVIISCPFAGCSITVNLSGEFRLGSNASVIAGAVWVVARDANLLEGSLVNVSALGGPPPSQTSGKPVGVQGAGGGHGANCLVDNAKLPEDVWGGYAYAWSELDKPWSFGSRGGTTSKEEDYGGGGGGRIRLNVTGLIELSGSLLANGGDSGVKGGGGSGGSIYIKAHKLTGNGRVSASGGNGFAGGSWGRVSIKVFSMHDNQEFLVHVLAAPKTLVLLGHFMMPCLGDWLSIITTCQQRQTHFSWSSLISHFGQMSTYRIKPRLLFLCSGVVYRGGSGRSQGRPGEDGTVTGKACPKGLHGIFCEVGFAVFLHQHQHYPNASKKEAPANVG